MSDGDRAVPRPRWTTRSSRISGAASPAPGSRTRSPGTGWDAGIPIAYLRELVDYWLDGYDWRREEARLNEFDHFRTRIDGQSIHFVHARSPHADALPLLLTHGWPGSIVEFLDVIPRLTDPDGVRRSGRRRVPRGRTVAARLRVLGAAADPRAGTCGASPRPSSTSWTAWATGATAPRAATGVPR